MGEETPKREHYWGFVEVVKKVEPDGSQYLALGRSGHFETRRGEGGKLEVVKVFNDQAPPSSANNQSRRQQPGG